MVKKIKTSSDLINELITPLPTWVHKRLVERGVVTWKLTKEEAVKKGLDKFTAATAGHYLVYRVPKSNDDDIKFIIRLLL